MANNKQSGKAPAYQWFPKDAETDEDYKLMTYEQQGIYRALLDHQWLEGSLPSDPQVIARLLPKIAPARFLRLWDGIAPCFVIEGGRLVNRRMETQRTALAVYIAEQRINGAKGGGTKAAKRRASDPTNVLPPNRSDPTLSLAGLASVPTISLVANPTSSSSSSTASTSATTEQPPAAVNARSKHPIFKGRRLVVFDWMLEDLRRMLGALTDDFDLDAWFYALDAETAKAGVVLPQRDGGKWLYDRTLEEAVRRGLPIVIAQTKQDLRRSSQSAQLAAWAQS